MLGDLLHETSSQKALLAQADRSARKSVSKVKLIEWSNSRVEQQFSRVNGSLAKRMFAVAEPIESYELRLDGESALASG